MTERLNLVVEDGVADLMAQLAGGERKRGQWIGNLVRAMHEQSSLGHGGEAEATHYAMRGLAGSVTVLEGRLARMEQQVTTLVADGQKEQ